MLNKKRFIIFTGGLSVFIAACIIFFNIFEPISTHNLAINFSKRVAAEAGNLFAAAYDPYVKESKKALLGPAGIAKETLDLKSGLYGDNYLRAHLAIVKYDNKPIVKSVFEFDYQPYDEKKLEVLRKKYNLESRINSARSELERIILIRKWLNAYLKFGIPRNISYNFNALDILERSERGEIFYCSEYTTTYIQLLASIGITARYVGLFKGHAVTEVWSDDYGKWVIMDPTYDIHYEIEGVPLNALELHDAWLLNKWKDIKVVSGENKEIDRYQFKLIDYYSNFFVRMRNDWLTNQYPRWYPKSNSIMNSLEFSDQYTRNDIRVARESHKIDDLYWGLNQVYIKLIGYKMLQDKIVLTLYLETVTPNFSGFLIKSNHLGDTAHITGPIFDWQLERGLNTLEVSSLNKFGITGKPAVVSIDYR